MRSVLLLAFVTLIALATAEDPAYKKQVDSSFVERQKKVLDIVQGISTFTLESKYKHEHQEFAFNKPEFFTNPKALEDFMRGYKRGYIPRDGVFTMNNYKARHDTFKLFELFYFAKDFDTFIDIAKWAKYELNAMQFSYAFTVAVIHRSDCRGMYLPPAYEMFPHYFVPSEVMRQADLASFYDNEFRVFKVNNTGFEYSWYNDMISGISKTHTRWMGDDFESRISYFREDPGLSHWYSISMARWATWLSPEKHPGIEFVKRGKNLYSMHKWLLSRYNLERMSADLPFVAPFDWSKEVIGYNSRLADYLGRPFVTRPDHMIPSQANPSGFSYIETLEERMYEAIDQEGHWDFKNSTYVKWDKKTGVDILGKMMFGERNGIGRYYYKPWFFYLLEAVNDMAHSSNDREYTNSVFGKYMTIVRDPLFFQVLASMDDWFETYYSNLPAYTEQELGFPGVKINKVEFDKLTTFFERWEYEITQGVVTRKPEERDNKKYYVSQPRLNHKPFKFTFTIESDRPQDSLIRVFFGPKKNIDNLEMSLNQARHAFFLGAIFPQKLKPGVNVITKNSEELYFYENFEPLRTFKERLAKSAESGKPFYQNMLNNCGLPSNLMLPRGSFNGEEYTAFVMVEPVVGEKTTKDQGYYHCNTHQYMDQPQITFPFDRPIYFPKQFKQPNMMFQDINIYHKSESDINRAY